MQVQVSVSNIVKQSDLQAIVNSANANLRLGSGVAGAIHAAAGHDLEQYCAQFAPLPLGQAIITPAFNLPNEFVIHIRAANYMLDDNAETVLYECLTAVFTLAKQHKIVSLAMPAIGTGVFKFPIELCATVTAQAIKDSPCEQLELIRICVVDEATKSAFESALAFAGLLP